LYWAEALDEGDPDKEAEYRDAVYFTGFPFDISEKSHLITTINRYSYTIWGPDDMAIVYDYWWHDRNRKVYMIDPLRDQPFPPVLFDLNTEDLYNDPGRFVTEKNEYNRNVLAVGKKRTLYLQGEGYGPEGNRPFIDLYKISSGETERLWQAEGETTYERIVDIIDIGKGEMITSVESVDENPQYYIRNIFRKIAPVQITDFPHPYESLKGMTKEFVQYKRADGVDLTATVYLPPGYDKEEDGPLPMILWAYPREYKDASAAGQVKTSPHRFTYLYYGSPIYWVNRGYVIMDRADFPVIGEGEEEPNDSFVEQLVANAEAAIDYAADRGIADPERVAVGGHSYGAFMTANLLSHSELFAAGIARSGAYNRTLTPFGFQAEERTYWEAPEIYHQMSPFMHADKMKTPLLLIHGEADNNSGTFPLQSKRYYHALKGHGATVRLVMLPYESHGYAARKNIMHMLWEQDEWLERWVK
jgi:dipeptidyl aminopeptidase/acylaminoacyl peptidase